VSPTYLSKVERDEFPPPVEDKVKAIAKIINCDAFALVLRNRTPMILLRSLVFHAAFYLTTAALAILGLPFLAILARFTGEQAPGAVEQCQLVC
jgi:hypothetical protein